VLNVDEINRAFQDINFGNKKNISDKNVVRSRGQARRFLRIAFISRTTNHIYYTTIHDGTLNNLIESK